MRIRDVRRRAARLMASPGAHPCGLCVIPIRDIVDDVGRWANRWTNGVPTWSPRRWRGSSEYAITAMVCHHAVIRTGPTSIPRTLTVSSRLSRPAPRQAGRVSSTRDAGGPFVFCVVSTDTASPGRLSPSGTGQEVTDDVGDPVVRNVFITLVWWVSRLFWIWPSDAPRTGHATRVPDRSDDRTAVAGPLNRTSTSCSPPFPRSRPARRTRP
jgi:hypothetical protein